MNLPSILQSFQARRVAIAIGLLFWMKLGSGALRDYSASSEAASIEQEARKVRAKRIREHNLKGEEVAALDLCVRSLGGRSGDCGCLAKHATEEMHEPYKTYAIRAAAMIMDFGRLTEEEAQLYLPMDTYTGLRTTAVTSIANAVRQCEFKMARRGGYSLQSSEILRQ